MGHVLSSKSLRDGSCSWLLRRTGQTNAVDEWAQAPLALLGALRGLDGEKVEAFGMLHTIMGLGIKRPFQLPLWYKYQ
jgi:hypothetical protein